MELLSRTLMQKKNALIIIFIVTISLSFLFIDILNDKPHPFWKSLPAKLPFYLIMNLLQNDVFIGTGAKYNSENIHYSQ